MLRDRMILPHTWLQALTAVLSAALSAQQAEPTRRLIVLNKAEATASLFDPAARKEIGVIAPATLGIGEWAA